MTEREYDLIVANLVNDKFNCQLALIFAQGGADSNAITLGQTTIWSLPYAQVIKDPQWIWHEGRHKLQWKKHGWYKMSTIYVRQYFKYGYINAPLEINANGQGEIL